MEKILSIAECQTKRKSDYGYFYACKGYEIKTDKQSINILIDSEQSCCESWGYFASEDDFTEFIGAELIGLKLVDDLLNVKNANLIEGDECYTMFVNVETSKGLLQFAVYNAHNGYYGHEVRVESKQLKHTDTL